MSRKPITYDTMLGHVLPLTGYKGVRVGIELEYEACHMHNVMDATPYWTYDQDHSLREGGMEFISNPLRMTHLPAALDQAESALTQSGGIVTKRCGLHVHVNVSDLSLRDIWKFATYYTLLEPFIFKKFADGREDSHFCVPTWANSTLQSSFYKDAVGLYRGIEIPSGDPILQLGGQSNNMKKYIPLAILDNPKYSAMNFTCMPKLGTIEFRQHRGTTDMFEVEIWARFLVKLREEALKYDDAEAVVEQYEKDTFFTLCENVGLEQSPHVNPEHLSDAVDAAIMMVGHKPTDHTTLNWEMK